MKHPIAKTTAAAAVALVLLVAVAAASVPQVRHIASGWWNNPETLAGLPENRRGGFQGGGDRPGRLVPRVVAGGRRPGVGRARPAVSPPRPHLPFLPPP